MTSEFLFLLYKYIKYIKYICHIEFKILCIYIYILISFYFILWTIDRGNPMLTLVAVYGRHHQQPRHSTSNLLFASLGTWFFLLILLLVLLILLQLYCISCTILTSAHFSLLENCHEKHSLHWLWDNLIFFRCNKFFFLEF